VVVLASFVVGHHDPMDFDGPSPRKPYAPTPEIQFALIMKVGNVSLGHEVHIISKKVPCCQGEFMVLSSEVKSEYSNLSKNTQLYSTFWVLSTSISICQADL